MRKDRKLRTMSPRCIVCDERSSRNEREYLQCEACDNWVCEDCECECEEPEDPEEEVVDEPMEIDYCWNETLGRCVEV